jgi:FAD/FMN-containing dehydrogenase
MTSVDALAAELAGLIGANKIRSGAAGLEKYVTDARGSVVGSSQVVALPQSVDDVQALLRYANARAIPVVPLGGHTGLVWAAGSNRADSIVVSLERMNRIEPPDTAGNTIAVGAGAILAHVREVAQAANRLFPMHLGSFGSCQVGGLISTNAGGVGVLKYGMMRDLVLGIEAVLPDGRLLRDMNRLRKNNVGYDLKQLLIGAEGTLGIVTAAVLKLFPLPQHQETALLAVPSVDAALELYHFLSAQCVGLISAFEYLAGNVMRLTERNLGLAIPLDGAHEHYVLVELDLPAVLAEAGLLTAVLSQPEAAPLWTDGTIATSEAQRLAFWHFRESIPEAFWRTRRSMAHDVSVPLGALSAFMATAAARLPKGTIAMPFGHMGDGNSHFSVLLEQGERTAQLIDAVGEIVYRTALEFGGSISAEHGIGREKIGLAERSLPAEAQRLRREVKKLIDPNRIMNPEALFGA